MFLHRSLAALLLIALFSMQLAASPANDLQLASARGKVAFLLVTEPNAPGIEQAKDIVSNAMKQTKKSVMIEFDRADAANRELVGRYRLAGAPVPLILVFAANGALAGGVPAEKTTAEQLVRIIPTPKKAEALKEVQDGRSVLITASQKGMATKSRVVSACAAACGQMQGKCSSIQIDMGDKNETAFLNELKINPQSAEPVTVVINAQGQVTGSFNGAVEVGNLVQAATKKVGGCCPGSSAASCGPKKK